MKSLDFFEELVLNENVFYNLMAPNGWDRDKNILKIDPEIYNIKEKKWVSKKPNTINGKPSIQTAHREFLEYFSVSRDKTSGLIYLSYTHYSPIIAKDFLDLILLQIDTNFRSEAINNANNSIVYLKKEYDKNKISEVRLGISNLIQKHIESITVANASNNFLFKEVSKPHIPELKSGPSRSIIVIATFIISSLLSFLVITVLSYKKK
jgi:capsule polysaccharide export protein KpsE/RkpR